MRDLPDQTGESRRNGEAGRAALWALLVFALALVSRIGLISYPPIYDELYQMLPAGSLFQGGDFSVLDGVYDRAANFTRLIAFSFNVFGHDGVVAARLLPVAVPGALLVALVFFWARMTAGIIAGWIAAVFMILWPNGIEVSQYVRFYALHGLFFVIGALALWVALEGRRPLVWRIGAGALALIGLLCAFDLQIMTGVGVVALGIWVALAHLPKWLRAEPRLWWALGLGVVIAVGALLSGIFTEKLRWIWMTYNWAPWPALDDKFFYHRDFRDNFPTFWPLFPVAALIALAARPRVAIFCISLYVTSFLIHSFGGLKNIRYLYATMPFFFTIWGVALQAVLPKLWAGLRDAAEAGLAPYAPQRSTGAMATAAMIVAAVFLFAGNAAFERASRMIAGQPANELLGKIRWTWAGAPETLGPWLKEGAVIVTSEEMMAVEWLGDFDLAYNKPRFSELLYSIGPGTPPFTPDRRTGRPLFGEFEDLARIVACEPVGLFVSNAPWLGSGGALRLAEAVIATGAHFETGRKDGLAYLGWRRPAGPKPADCAAIPLPGEDRAAARIISGARTPAHVSLP